MSCVAVIPARRAESSVGAALESLRLANADFVDRVIVVTSAADPTAGVVAAWAALDSRVHLVALAAPVSAGVARNEGRAAAARLAGAGSDPSLLLFLDADCRLERGGASRLGEELDSGRLAAVSARVVGEGGIVARVRHLLEFKEAASLRPAPASWLPPSTTLLCRADAFDEVGGFPDLWPGEDLVFSCRLRDRGGRVLRSPSVVTRHRHPGGVLVMLAHQLRLGSTAAQARRLQPMPGSAFAGSPWRALLLFPARLLRTVLWQLGEGRAAVAWTLLLAPLWIAGLAVWTAGFAAASRGPRAEAAPPREIPDELASVAAGAATTRAA